MFGQHACIGLIHCTLILHLRLYIISPLHEKFTFTADCTQQSKSEQIKPPKNFMHVMINS